MGGAQRVLFSLIESLPADEYEITLVCSPGGELIEWIERLNDVRSAPIRVIPLESLKRQISPTHDLKAFSSLLRLMRTERYDVVHFHSSKMGILGRLVAWVVGVPNIIFTVHGWGIGHDQSPLLRRLLGMVEKMIGRLGATIVCVAEHDRQVGIDQGYVPINSTLVVHNGVPQPEYRFGELRQLVQADDGHFLLGTVCRLADVKNPDIYIHTAAALQSMGFFAFKLLLIGDGPLRSHCEDLVEQFDLGGCVIMTGAREDAPALLSDLDLFLLLSRQEAFPLVVLEAMQAGLPVIATRVGGIPEQVEDGVTGFLVDPNPEAIAMTVMKLVSDVELRRAMAEAARARAERFSLEGMCDAYRHLYQGGRRMGEGGR